MRHRTAAGRALPVLVAVFASLALGPNCAADQSDPKLDSLFVQLREAAGPAAAKRAEREIWSIWHKTPDDKSLEIMREARTALDANDLDAAIKFLDQLVEYAPDFAEAWNQRAIALFLAEDYEAALRDIARTLALEPRHFGALSGRGQIYLRLEDPERALQAFESALELNPWLANIRSQMEMTRAYLNARQKPI